jgi:hypothetical protein
MNMEDMFHEVNRQVADRIMEHILPKAIETHAAREWKNCNCSYCVTKRNATVNIAHCVYPEGFVRPLANEKLVYRGIDPLTFKAILYIKNCEPWEYKKIIRNDLRKQYRNKLKKLCNQ